MFKYLFWRAKEIYEILGVIRNNTAIVNAGVKESNEKLSRLEADMETVRWLAEEERKIKEQNVIILWVTLSKNGQRLEERYCDYLEVSNFFGTRYKDALDALRDAGIGSSTYIDDALFVKVKMHRDDRCHRRFYVTRETTSE